MKLIKKLIFIISILMIVALNLFGEEKIEFKYYYYTNKIYHSTLKTEIIPSEYVFITTYSNEDYNSYTYNLKTKEKKLFYTYKYMNNEEYKYYDIKGNLTTNWTDENMKANGFYEITNNRFGETFYTLKNDDYSIGITKTNDYIQKAYKYSLTQPEIINKKDRGIYLFKIRTRNYYKKFGFTSRLCFQNEYYSGGYFNGVEESDLLNYNSNGRVVFNNIDFNDKIKYSSSILNFLTKRYDIVGIKQTNDNSIIVYGVNTFQYNKDLRDALLSYMMGIISVEMINSITTIHSIDINKPSIFEKVEEK